MSRRIRITIETDVEGMSRTAFNSAIRTLFSQTQPNDLIPGTIVYLATELADENPTTLKSKKP